MEQDGGSGCQLTKMAAGRLRRARTVPARTTLSSDRTLNFLPTKKTISN